MKPLIGLDFETYSDVDLIKHGLHQYVNGTYFQPLIAVTVEADEQGYYVPAMFDFTQNLKQATAELYTKLVGKTIVAHNAGFEQAVLKKLGIFVSSDEFIDSAVLARAAGAAGKLEVAAPQLLDMDKLEMGYDLIKLFSIPGKYQADLGRDVFDTKIIEDNLLKWHDFITYCAMDAELSLRIAEDYPVSDKEQANNAVTMDMNNVGWYVDMAAVRNMHGQYLINLAQAEADFRRTTGATELNFSSPKQLMEWCADRGVRASSFSEEHVTNLLRVIDKKLATPASGLTPLKRQRYEEVSAMLHTKQILGGSSLKKLQTIIDTVGTDGRLHDQYLHIGAGATYRTSGRGVQMQNLHRLNGQGANMDQLLDPTLSWSNAVLAANLRQVFTASAVDGQLIVGDFSSVESRGLAWQAGEQWKLDAYHKGEDLYILQAAKIFGRSPDLIVKAERQVGKVGELSCGYGAGGPAVQEFAAKMGVELSEAEAMKLVKDWREANPKTVDYWNRLHDALQRALEHRVTQLVELPEGHVRIHPILAPNSLRKQTGDSRLLSLKISLGLKGGAVVLVRVIHGTTQRGNNIHYWKPTERKTGNLWSNKKSYLNPKTKQHDPHTLYGGKLAGILTQSLCREVFFHSLREVHRRLTTYNVSNVELVGQFHDEIVLDWTPGNATLDNVKVLLNDCMTTTMLPGFPLAAEIKSDYRYTK